MKNLPYAAFTPDTCSLDTSCISTCNLVSGYKLLVRDTCVRLHCIRCKRGLRFSLVGSQRLNRIVENNRRKTTIAYINTMIQCRVCTWTVDDAVVIIDCSDLTAVNATDDDVQMCTSSCQSK